MGDYRFGSGSFKGLLWMNKGAVFENPTGIDVEFESAGAFVIRIADASGKVRKDHAYDNKNGGWNTCDMSSLGIHGGSYKLGFVNASPGEKRIRQGVVYARR